MAYLKEEIDIEATVSAGREFQCLVVRRKKSSRTSLCSNDTVREIGGYCFCYSRLEVCAE